MFTEAKTKDDQKTFTQSVFYNSDEENFPIEEVRKILDCENQENDSPELSNALLVPIKAEKDADAEGQINNLVNTVIDVRENIVERLTKFIDDKLDGLDEVMVELIKCKTENERLKLKIDQLNKDNYSLKTEVESFKPVTLGLYLKKK